jgi:hypothetical protein
MYYIYSNTNLLANELDVKQNLDSCSFIIISSELLNLIAPCAFKENMEEPGHCWILVRFLLRDSVLNF